MAAEDETKKDSSAEPVSAPVVPVETVPEQAAVNAENSGLCQRRKKFIKVLFTWWIILAVLGPLCICCCGGCVIAWSLMMAAGKGSASLLGGMILLLIPLVLLCAFVPGILYFILFYNYWKLIPEKIAVTTPAKAVGYLFIPFFNVYWTFIAGLGLSRGMEAVTGRKAPGRNFCVWVYCIGFAVISIAGILLNVLVLAGINSLWLHSVISGCSGFFGIVIGVMWFISICLFQKEACAILDDTSAPWKDNQECSKRPILTGILLAVIFAVIIFSVSILTLPFRMFSPSCESESGTGKTVSAKVAVPDSKTVNKQAEKKPAGK